MSFNFNSAVKTILSVEVIPQESILWNVELFNSVM